jgi:crossover junction endodeoxyribonuclease RusA
MATSITLTLPYPISANRYWATRTVTPKGGRTMALTYITPEAKAFKAAVLQLARAAGITAPISGRVQLDVQLYPHRPLDSPVPPGTTPCSASTSTTPTRCCSTRSRTW